MHRARPGDIPYAGGTAVQEDPDRPVFNGNGALDFTCAECGNVLARAMDAGDMTFKVRVRCGRCRTINVAEHDERTPEERRQRGRKGQGGGPR